MLIEHISPHGGDIYTYQIDYDFSANISPLGTPTSVRKALVNASADIASYPDPYCRKLRERLATFHGISPNHILCGNGAAELIFSFVTALKPHNALIVAPTFSEYEHALKAVDCSVHHFLLSKSQNFTLPSNFIQSITPNLDAIFICNPNNPTGVLYPKELLQDIARKCASTHTLLFVDECFFDLTDAPNSDSLVTIAPSCPNIVVLKAFTKSYGMAGVRLGYAISSNEELLRKICSTTQVWNVSTLAQEAGIAALDCTDHIKKSLGLIHTERKYLKNELEMLGLTVFHSNANFLLFQSSDNQLFDKLLVKKIMIRHCNNFVGLDDSFYRCAIKDHASNTALLAALKEVLHNG